MRVIKIVLVPILLLFAGGLAAADPFTKLWIFGDSTVDTGWYRYSKSDEMSYDKYMQPTMMKDFGVGRPTSSPGEMSVEVLADALGLQAIPADKKNASGTNYATGGAKNFRHNLPMGDGFPGAVPTITQLNNYLTAHHSHASSTALYVISSGDNDVAFALKHPGNKNYLTKAANALAKEISVLQQDGAKYIIVVGLPQSYGSTQQKKNFRATYNTKLKNKLDSLLGSANFLWADANHVRQVMESYKNNPPSPFGITNYTIGKTGCTQMCPDSACSMPDAGTGITTDWAYVCSTTAGAPSTATNDAASEWADDNHYATGGQKVLGTYFYCAAKNQWPTLAWSSNPTLPFDCTTVASAMK